MQDILSKTNKRNYFRSSSFMMAMLFTVLLGTAAALLGYTGYYLNRNHFIQSIETVLDTEYSYLKDADKSGQLYTLLNERLGATDRVYYVRDTDNVFLFGNIKSVPPHINSLQGDILYFTPDGQAHPFAAKIYELPSRKTILIGSDMASLIYTERVILWMGATTILLMMLVVIVSYMISTFVVSRTNHIAETARKIMQTGDLSQRISIDTRWDDLSHMAFVLNSLLERIDHLMQGIKRVADNIAHDLRTPLTRLRNQLDVLKDDPQQSRQHIDGLIQESDHILHTFQAVLRISKIENLSSQEHFKACDLSKILRDVHDYYEPLAAEKNINFEQAICASSPYVGDIDLLFQMFANIIDNAIKFTPPHGKVLIECHQPGQIFISDTGQGIPVDEQPYVFDRFYRGETSRATQGNGLGLSLVQAVLKLHQGRISMENQPVGLKIHISL